MKSNIEIRKAKSSEAQAIRKLEHEIWKEEVVNKYDIPMLIRFGYVYVAYDGDSLVGAVIAFCTNNNEIFVSDIVIDSDHQGQGIGERLYQKLLHDTKGKDIFAFVDPQRVASVKLHEKLGGTIVERVKDPYDLEHDGGLETGVRLLFKIKN